MTDRTGRHAAARDVAATLIIPAQRWPDEDRNGESGPDGPVRRATGRHAAGRPADEVVPDLPGDGTDDLTSYADRAEQAAANGALGNLDRVPRRDGADPAPVGRRSAGGSESMLRLVWVFPDLLSTYGDRGNLLVLGRRARLRGIEVEAIEVNSDQAVPRQGDIYLLGGGEDLPQILAANRLRADGGLAAAAGQGSVVFAVCAGYQVLGHRFGGVEGEPVAGLGVLDITSGRGDRRGVGELVADVDPALGVPRFTGFENHQGVTKIGSGARPLARVTVGVGNGDGTEGAYAGQVLGTYMHGPALARNPGLADLLLTWAVGQLAPLDPDAEEWASQLRAERLAAVSM
jgi:lipid II isoglutaminyl synthase (glutamine-hydrolysing)